MSKHQPRQPASSVRSRVNARSYRVLALLHSLPRWVVPVGTAILALAGVFAPPIVGGACLLVVAVFLLWLGYLAWPQLSAGGRVSRTVVIAIVAAVALARMFGMWN